MLTVANLIIRALPSVFNLLMRHKNDFFVKKQRLSVFLRTKVLQSVSLLCSINRMEINTGLITISKVIAEAQVDTALSLAQETKFGEHVRLLLPPDVRKTILGITAHYVSMGYIHTGCESGELEGKASWEKYNILQLEKDNQIYKFRRTNNFNDLPRSSDHMKKSETVNEMQSLLFDLNDYKNIEHSLHWLVCSGFHNGVNLKEPLSSEFFSWVSRFDPDPEVILNGRDILCRDVAGEILKKSQLEKVGHTYQKPILTPNQKEEIIEESIKKAINE